MSGKIIVTEYREGRLSALVQNDRVLELHYHSNQNPSLVGNIYVGRVRDVVKNIQAAFIDFGEGNKGYFPISDATEALYTRKGTSPVIQQGDELIVQVKKDAVKTKDPALTSEISVSSRYFVGMIGREELNVSHKLSPSVRQDLKEMILPYKKEDLGLIIRTNAADAQKEELLSDLMQLQERLNELKRIAPYRPIGTCLYRESGEYLNFIKNMKHDLPEEIITDQKEVYAEVQQYLYQEQLEQKIRTSLYHDAMLPLLKLYRLERAVEEATHEKVWLKSGGYLVIQPTEALTVIDVNSGKFSEKKNPEESFLKVNLEAARECACQMRLRNLSGIIIIDFINMKSKEDQQILLDKLSEYLKADPVQAQVIDLTPLGLVEVTRKRRKGTFAEQLSTQNVKSYEE